jgi:C4-dicarboxylate-binding protein DctP
MNSLTATRSMVDIEFVVLVNEKVWQDLAPEHRQVMEAAAARVEQQLRDEMNQLEAEAFAFVADKMKIIELSEAELQEWQKLAEPVINTYIKNAGPLGQQLVDAARAL